MSNLLDKASILLSPTAYNNGSMLSVKPTDGDGDFTFVRGSAATRVNAQGLVENVQIISPELVTNGNFSQIGSQKVTNGNFSQEGTEQITNGDFATDSDWTKGTGWSIGGGTANRIATGSYTNISQNGILTAGKTYKVTYTVNSGSIGGVRVQLGGTFAGDYNGVGTHAVYGVSGTTAFNNFMLVGEPTFTGSIDNVSVKEVGQDWTLGTGWSIGEDKAIGSSATGTLQQLGILQSNKTYRLTYTILDYVSGSIRPNVGTVNGTLQSSNGTFTEYITSLGTHFYFDGVSAFTGSVTNVSLKEVGQGWTIEDVWTIGDGVANGNGANGTSEELSQSNVVTIGKTYSISYEVKNYVSGIIRLRKPQTINRNANGTYTEIVTATAASFIFSPSNFNGSITNISVKEITDDTNLPRINYEGFSYQDSLGSELVTNGDFSNGGADWNIEATWTISGGVANGNGANGGGEEIEQLGILIAGRTYNATYEVKNYVSGSVNLQRPTGISRSANGVYTEILTAATALIKFRGANFNGSITNISIKEYLGQEVVPDSGCGSWLLENQSTNLYLNSGDASQWNFGGNGFPNNTTRVDNQSSPDGETNASLFSRDTGTSGWFGSNTNATNSETYTHSVFVKKGTSSTVEIRNVNNNPQSSITYNIDTNTVTVENNATGKSVNYGNGWYRVEMTFEYTNAAGTTSQIRHTLEDGKSMSVFGAQSEEQTHSTSYIPTSGATNTRNQDLSTNSGNATLINSTEGVLYAEIAALADGVNGRYISIGDGSLSNYVYIRITGILNEIKMGVIKGGSTQASKSFTVPNLKQSNKLAVSYQQDLFRFYVNGTLIFTDTNGDIFPIGTLNALTFNLANTNNYFNGKNKCLAVYKEALTSAELQCLTTI